MKAIDTLTYLYGHNLWANLSLLEVCAKLTAEQLQASLTGTFGSVYDTLVHIVSAERSYYSRISTGQPYFRDQDADPMAIDEMIVSARETGAGLIEWAHKVEVGDTVEVDWNGTPREVPKTVILTQAINHATEHRAQVMAILTQIGIEPPSLDSWTYFNQQAG
jgi:uncharacterized damage-inducible protein DinB